MESIVLRRSPTVALVLSYVTPGLPMVVITIVMLVLFAVLWFAFPLSRRR